MSRHILPTGAQACYNAQGQPISCRDSLQDAALGIRVPVPLPADWEEALKLIDGMNANSEITWHLPNINELESLVGSKA